MAEPCPLLVALDRKLLSALDALAKRRQSTRDALINDALFQYLALQHKIETREMMQKGYEHMAGINSALAEEGLRADIRILEAYEAMLSECENHDCQTR